MKTLSNPLKLVLALVTLLVLSCAPLMSTFDQASYAQVTSLKVDALALIDKSTEDYTAHVAEVNALKLELDKAIEYDKHRPHNDITNEMWNLMSDTTGHLLGGFFVKWKHDGKERPAQVTNLKKIVGDNFDRIADLEIKKIKP